MFELSWIRGIGNLLMQYCSGQIAQKPDVDFSNLIKVQTSAGNGWTGQITDIRATEFDITFTKSQAGLEITGEMQLIEEP